MGLRSPISRRDMNLTLTQKSLHKRQIIGEFSRLILEGIAIKAHDNLVNLQAGFMINECWTPYLARQGGANQTISDISG